MVRGTGERLFIKTIKRLFYDNNHLSRNCIFIIMVLCRSKNWVGWGFLTEMRILLFIITFLHLLTLLFKVVVCR